jgi:hypothetical protein
MAMDDYMEPEVAVAVAVTAAVASPKVRKALRKGAVYGLAGLLMAGDALSSFTKSAVRGAQQAASSARESLASVRESVEESTAGRKSAAGARK